MTEISRRPPIDICSVRGMGVAVESVRTSTCVRQLRLEALLVRDAEALLLVDDDEAEILEAARRARGCGACRRRRRAGPRPGPRRSTWLARRLAAEAPRGPRRARGSRRSARRRSCRCCSASTVVGARMATCLPPEHGQQRTRAARRSVLRCSRRRLQTRRSHGHAVLHVGEHRLDGARPDRASRRRGRSPRTPWKVASRRWEGVRPASAACAARRAAAAPRRPCAPRPRRGRRLSAHVLPPSLSRRMASTSPPEVAVAEADAVDGDVDRAAVVLEVHEVLAARRRTVSFLRPR